MNLFSTRYFEHMNTHVKIVRRCLREMKTKTKTIYYQPQLGGKTNVKSGSPKLYDGGLPPNAY
jgi:hypothetical protein